MTKILALVGSLRAASYNRRIYEVYKELAQGKVDMTEGKFDDFPLYNADLHTAGFPEVVLRLAGQIREADGILFVSPEYNYSVPGALKNALDWVSRLENQPFSGKRAAIMGASPGKVGTARMQYHLRQIGVFLNISFMNRPEVMVSEVHKIVDENGRLTAPKTRDFLKTHLNHFREFLS